MTPLKKYLSRISPDDGIFGCIALTFLLLPTGTAPPLIGFGLAVAVWLFSGQFTRMVSIFKQTWFRPVILFILLPWIGLTYSLNLDLGMDYAMKTKYWIALVITAGLYMDDKRTHILIIALWTGLFMGAVLALIQFFGFAAPIKVGFLGFGIVHTLVSMYLIIGILMAAFYFKRAENMKYKAVMIALILAFFFHLTVLGGRSGYVIFAVTSPLVARDLLIRFSLKIKILLSVFLVLSLFLSPIVRDRVKITIREVKANKEKIMRGEYIPLVERAFIISETVKVIKKHPWVGIGTGSLTEPSRANGHEVAHPHNNFLYMAVSFGIAGTIACFWLFWNMFARSWKFRQTPLGYFVFSTCLVLFFGGMFDTQILNTCTLLMLAMTYGFLNHLDDPGKRNA